MLVSTQIHRANSGAALKTLTRKKIILPLFSMEHQNGQEQAARGSLGEQTSCHNQMALSAAQPITHSTHKNVEQNAMARSASSMRLVLVIAVSAHYANSV
jgi:hypothetical protein